MFSQLRSAVVMFVLLTLVTGLVYPLTITALAQLAFPRQANGSLIERDGQVLGSELIGQPFSGAGYFWSRPSATSPNPYTGTASGGSNLGPTNPALREAVKARVDALRSAQPGDKGPVPVDLVTSSASGLDPHISPAAAEYQLGRVARRNNLSEDELRLLVQAHTAPRMLGLLGEPRVNVLALNLALHAKAIAKKPATPGTP